MSSSLDPDQARQDVGPDLGPNCLQRLSADDTCRQKVNSSLIVNSLVWILTGSASQRQARVSRDKENFTKYVCRCICTCKVRTCLCNTINVHTVFREFKK